MYLEFILTQSFSSVFVKARTALWPWQNLITHILLANVFFHHNGQPNGQPCAYALVMVVSHIHIIMGRLNKDKINIIHIHFNIRLYLFTW